jgi:hypothetical protein
MRRQKKLDIVWELHYKLVCNVIGVNLSMTMRRHKTV